jgi:hypothetical protein
MPNFEDMISRLDTALYKNIDAELNEGDRKSLLAVQKAVREHRGTYCYLEIGSHLGGSIQPYLLDTRCVRIYSIDKRPFVVPDDRGEPIKYPENSTQRMMQLLARLSPGEVSKIVCFDDDAKNVAPVLISEKPDICFIDGEHTTQAVISDFAFCRSVVRPDGVICFHDSEAVWKGLREIVRGLKALKVSFQFVRLGGVVSVIGFDDAVWTKCEELASLRSSGWRYFAFYHRLAELQRKHFDFRFINLLKPTVRTTLNWARRLTTRASSPGRS